MHRRFGWAMTCMSDKLKLVVKEMNINYEVFKLVRQETVKIKAQTKMKKWKCSCTVVRCAVVLDATCNGCKKPFEEQ